VWVALAGAVWFALIYGGADYVTGRRATRIPVNFAWESRIPFVAPAAWLYMSVYALFAMAPFVLRSPEIIALGAALAVDALVAGVTFLLVPSALAFPPIPATADPPGVTSAVYGFADWLNLRYNLLPSLHVALSVTCVAAYAERASGIGKAILWTWASAIAVSTLLTHFHHVADVVTGFALGLIGYRVTRAVAGALAE
jgi:membrane-associated phospholipid phosphatase